MKVFLATDKEGFALKNYIKDILSDFELVDSLLDLTPTAADDFVESAKLIANELTADSEALAIAFDGYGCGSFIVLNKHKGLIAAEISEERSAYMTREHNNARAICLGSEIVGQELAKSIVIEFLKGAYAGGRHQIRVDMLNSMC